MDTPLLIDTRRMATLSGISYGQLVRLRNYQPDRSPPFISLGRQILYPVAAVEKWIADRQASSCGGK